MSQTSANSTRRAADNVLDDRAKKWLASLEEKIRPSALAEKYPRIANRIALLWTEPELMRKYFDEVMVDERGGRAGFAEDIMTEMATLRHFYDSEVHPVKTDIWHKILTQIH